MTLQAALAQLKLAGTAQNRKIYARHGVSDDMYGVSYAKLEKLRKLISIDHELALALWRTGNHDARVLATKIADPNQATIKLLDSWKNDLANCVITDAFSAYVGTTRLAQKRMELWTRSRREWIGRAGWLLLAGLAIGEADWPDHFFEDFLENIEDRIATGPNRTRDAMNAALIAIGMRNSRLEQKAIAAARRIGKIEVDHGQTSCKTPDAEGYILKARRHKVRRRASAC